MIKLYGVEFPESPDDFLHDNVKWSEEYYLNYQPDNPKATHREVIQSFLEYGDLLFTRQWIAVEWALEDGFSQEYVSKAINHFRSWVREAKEKFTRSIEAMLFFHTSTGSIDEAAVDYPESVESSP